MNVDFEKQGGLVPAIVQDARTRRVLMLGYMNREALEVTQHSGRVTFFSRSRQELWTKGETSGSYLEVEELKVDCDRDTLLVRARPLGPTCHTGADTCFAEENRLPALEELQDVIRDRAMSPSGGSYTRKLLDAGPRRIAKKLGEEAVETALEAESGEPERLIEEAADLVYHLLVLLRSRGLEWSDLGNELQRRRRRAEDDEA
jgi:phosphoribosyl-ATP pyrophosphohydrolase/phosphoribosyl-AMP cyclohydrolase